MDIVLVFAHKIFVCDKERFEKIGDQNITLLDTFLSRMEHETVLVIHLPPLKLL